MAEINCSMTGCGHRGWTGSYMCEENKRKEIGQTVSTVLLSRRRPSDERGEAR